LGHRRLSILDISARGHQPMTSADGKLTIAFNGEIYNFRELREELEQAGAVFRSDTDTEVLLHAYRAWGSGAFPRLNGMFSFAIWDVRGSRLLLARDRIGIKPLFWSLRDSVLVFGSELCALRLHRGFSQRIDQGALGRYLRHGYVGGTETIYEDVHRLPPGHQLVFDGGDVRIDSYWNLCSPVAECELRYEDAIDHLDKLLGDAVEHQLISDVPLGAFLSGGVDSSTVVALMQERSSRPVKTFAIGFEEARWDEAPYARAVAEHLRTEHRSLYVTRSDAAEVARRLPELYDEPFADPSAIPTVLLCRLARRDVTVSLSGDGGDEVFGGYRHYAQLGRLNPWLHLPAAIRGFGGRVAEWLPRGGVRNGLTHLRSRDSAALAYGLISAFDSSELVAACGEDAGLPSRTYLDAFEGAPTAEAERRAMYGDIAQYLPDDILVKVDRASMSCGLEARVPLLDHRVVEFGLSLPLSFLRRDGGAKAPLREVLYRRIPRALVERPKHGFGIPVHILLASEIRDWRQRYLDPARIRDEGNFDPEGVTRLLAHASQRFDEALETTVVWRILCFQRWYARIHRGESMD
jgi:asparagine synthase (glutamine-hydrolysing)